MSVESPTLFVVDDDPAVRAALQAAGQHLRLLVEVYPTAEEFLERLDVNRHGCLILDLKMPKIDGLQLQNLLRERECCLPVIMISGHGDVPSVVSAMRQGALTFLEKPFGLNEISAQIRSALETAADWRARWARRRDARERLARLTHAQRTVFDLLASGLSNKQIAQRLGLSLRAIEDRKARLIQSLQLVTIVDLFDLSSAAETPTPPYDRDGLSCDRRSTRAPN